MTVIVCNSCDEHIPEQEYTELCPHCGGKVADRYGKVWVQEIEDRRKQDGRENQGPTG